MPSGVCFVASWLAGRENPLGASRSRLPLSIARPASEAGKQTFPPPRFYFLLDDLAFLGLTLAA